MQKGMYNNLEEYLYGLNQLRFAEAHDKIKILGCTAGKTYTIEYLELN